MTSLLILLGVLALVALYYLTKALIKRSGERRRLSSFLASHPSWVDETNDALNQPQVLRHVLDEREPGYPAEAATQPRDPELDEIVNEFPPPKTKITRLLSGQINRRRVQLVSTERINPVDKSTLTVPASYILIGLRGSAPLLYVAHNDPHAELPHSFRTGDPEFDRNFTVITEDEKFAEAVLYSPITTKIVGLLPQYATFRYADSILVGNFPGQPMEPEKAYAAAEALISVLEGARETRFRF